MKLAECARTAEPWIRHLVERTEDDMAARVAAVKAAQRRTTAFQQVAMVRASLRRCVDSKEAYTVASGASNGMSAKGRATCIFGGCAKCH